MSITRFTPNTIHLGGRLTNVNDLVAGEALTPGMLLERYNASAGVAKLRKHSTAAVATSKIVCLNASMLNKGIDDAYASGDLVESGIGTAGSTFYMLIASGQNLVAGDKLESAGNGLLRKLASGIPLFTALVDTDNSAGPSTMRIKVEAL